MKALFEKLVPSWLASPLRQWKRGRERRRNAALSVEEVFTDIYLSQRWGGAEGEFCSGGGTRDERVVEPYLKAVIDWLNATADGRARVVDLGCGDFTVGSRMIPHCESYVGVDVVKPLIEHHQRQHSRPTVRFEHLNIISDDLPAGDVCLVRQVLQHLSNEEICMILEKLRQYRHAIITEHLPEPSDFVRPNLDKAHGADIRLTANSGVYLEHPPFSVPGDAMKVLLEVPWEGNHGGVLRTVVISHGT